MALEEQQQTLEEQQKTLEEQQKTLEEQLKLEEARQIAADISQDYPDWPNILPDVL